MKHAAIEVIRFNNADLIQTSGGGKITIKLSGLKDKTTNNFSIEYQNTSYIFSKLSDYVDLLNSITNSNYNNGKGYYFALDDTTKYDLSFIFNKEQDTDYDLSPYECEYSLGGPKSGGYYFNKVQ